MKDAAWLHELYNLKQEQLDKAEYLKSRYDNGTLSKDSYDDQMLGVENTIDILGRQTEEEIQKQDLTEQEYQEAREQWQQEQERGR
jgi:hypothetical protein